MSLSKLTLKKAKSGDQESLQLIINTNLKIIYKIAHNFKNYQIDFEDLVQEGVLGLQEAIKRFDLRKKNKFITFANYWILNYIAEYCRKNYRTIRIPNYILADSKKINKYKNNYFNKYKKFPSEETVCKRLSFTKKKFKRIEDTIQSEIISLDNEISDNKDMFNYIPSFYPEESEYVKVFNILSEEEREMLELNSGIFGPKVSYKQLAKKYNKTFQYIKTSIDRSKRKIRKKIKSLK